MQFELRYPQLESEFYYLLSPGFELGTLQSRAECVNHYTTVLRFFVILLSSKKVGSFLLIHFCVPEVSAL